jgi:hypothetical protein
MPRKLEPGFEATYSKLSDFRMSTMKSPPGRSVVRTSTPVGSASRGGVGAGPPACAGGAACGAAAEATASGTSAAAPVTAAPLRKPLRSTEPCAMVSSRNVVEVYIKREGPIVEEMDPRWTHFRRADPGGPLVKNTYGAMSSRRRLRVSSTCVAAMAPMTATAANIRKTAAVPSVATR